MPALLALQPFSGTRPAPLDASGTHPGGPRRGPCLPRLVPHGGLGLGGRAGAPESPPAARGPAESDPLCSLCCQSCHEGHCPFVLTECPACKGLVRLGEKERHLGQECPERSLSCRHCRAPCCSANMKVRRGRPQPRAPGRLCLRHRVAPSENAADGALGEGGRLRGCSAVVSLARRGPGLVPETASERGARVLPVGGWRHVGLRDGGPDGAAPLPSVRLRLRPLPAAACFLCGSRVGEAGFSALGRPGLWVFLTSVPKA